MPTREKISIDQLVNILETEANSLLELASRLSKEGAKPTKGDLELLKIGLYNYFDEILVETKVDFLIGDTHRLNDNFNRIHQIIDICKGGE